ncbi:MAG: 50S ribosomal protein L10 [Christensenellaceae bacterium]|jgi:large subunit ribosomal protein L10|nr:50S ribosomal protein L10 [Christensenellaceae bacterium]
MANIKNIEMKANQVAQVQEKLKKAQTVVVFDYRGLTVEEVSALRVEARKQGVEYVVLKNAIVERAAKAAELGDAFFDYLKGPSAFAFGYDDAVIPAKIIKDAIKKYKKCEIKGGLINGVVTDAAGMETLADLPSREVLISRLLGSMMSPLSGLAIVLDQVAKKNGAPEAAQEA